MTQQYYLYLLNCFIYYCWTLQQLKNEIWSELKLVCDGMNGMEGERHPGTWHIRCFPIPIKIVVLSRLCSILLNTHVDMQESNR